MVNNAQNKSVKVPLILWGLVAFATSFVIFIFGLYLWKFANFRLNLLEALSNEQHVWGEFGDYIGGILNPWFSFATLIALLYTIHLQRKELHDSAKAIALQQFVTHFFQMLELFNGLVSALELSFKNPDDGTRHSTYNGKFCFVELAKIMKNEFIKKAKDKDTISNKYTDFQINNSYLLDHYFRFFYSIINFIDNSDLEDKDKKFYVNIVRDQLNRFEITLLFYNLFLKDSEHENKVRLMKKYHLLKFLDNTFLVDPEHKKFIDLTVSNPPN